MKLTLVNKIESYKSGIEPGVPTVQDIGSIVDEEVTLAEAQASIPFKLAIPSYLPHEANTRRVVLTSLGADVYQISIEYNLNESLIVFSQQNIANGISRGSLYDTDDQTSQYIIGS